MKIRFLPLVLLLSPSPLLADTVYLKGGGKVSGRIVTVRVDAISELPVLIRNRFSGKSESVLRDFFNVTNLSTGRRTKFRSAAKFRGPAEKAVTQ